MVKKILSFLIFFSVSLCCLEQPVGTVKDVYGFGARGTGFFKTMPHISLSEELEAALKEHRNNTIELAIEYLDEYINNPREYAFSPKEGLENIAVTQEILSSALSMTRGVNTAEEIKSARFLALDLYKNLRNIFYLNRNVANAEMLKKEYAQSIKTLAESLKGFLIRALQ